MGISFRLGLTTNVNVGDGEMRTSTSLKITEMSDKQFDNNQKQSPDKKKEKKSVKQQNESQ